jgi:hypothetical protein
LAHKAPKAWFFAEAGGVLIKPLSTTNEEVHVPLNHYNCHRFLNTSTHTSRRRATQSCDGSSLYYSTTSIIEDGVRILVWRRRIIVLFVAECEQASNGYHLDYE